MTHAPSHPPPEGPPGLLALLAEVTTPWQFARLALAAPRLARAPRGHGGCVIDIPGWRAPETSTLPLRTYLRGLGHDARPWGLGTNLGDPEGDAARLAERIRSRSGPPVTLVGWSLGGVVAREVARAFPEHVRRVITYGTPVVGGPTHTVAGRSWGDEASARITRRIEQVEAERPIRVPITAIYSRRDGIVDWRACLDRRSPSVEHVEVGSTHLGLGIDPDVWTVIADRLADA